MGGGHPLEWKQGVATTAESYSLKRGPAKPPISTHPAFPAITALWFAALLGFGSLVLPIALLERLGFRREGLLRAEWETHIGVRDSVILGLLRDEWRSARREQ